MEVPCGYCIGCRLDRAKDWALRITHEAQMHQSNAFLTLTYAPEHLPEDGSLQLEDYQKFMKRLRFETEKPLRFFHCGEYGEKFARPHYHACVFGLEFDDLELIGVNHVKQKLYKSEKLDRIWGKGHASIGEVTFQSAGYVARYITKKVVGEQAEDHYLKTDPETGEITKLKPEYTTMSRQPGLGRSWFDKYWRDIYPKDFVTVEGKKFKPPRYYDKLLQEHHENVWEDVYQARIERAINHKDNTDERLAVRQFVQEDKAKKLLRNYETANL
jgi:hypothetical protein